MHLLDVSVLSAALEATDVSNLDPRWPRACADRRGRAQTGDGARRRVRAGAHTSAKKIDPSGTHGLMHRDCSTSGWII